jgi:hypothetical protein
MLKNGTFSAMIVNNQKGKVKTLSHQYHFRGLPGVGPTPTTNAMVQANQ